MRFLISGMTSLVVAAGMTAFAVAAQTQPQSQTQPQAQQPQTQQQQPQTQQPQTQQTQPQQPQTQQPQTSSSQMNAQNQNSKGYSATEVRQAQEQLKKDGNYTGNIDGIYGPATRAAVEKYQQNQNLKVSGRLDSETCAKLGIHK